MDLNNTAVAITLIIVTGIVCLVALFILFAMFTRDDK